MSFNNKNGFSLFELLVTLVIIAILAVMSYPIYANHLQTARRKHAEIILLMIANHLEAYRSVHDSYRGATLNNLAINTQDEMNYKFLIEQQNDQHYLLTAIPLNTQAKDRCGTLKLDAIGNQTASDFSDKCW